MDGQDAHEMLHVLMTILEEEISSKGDNNKTSHASLLDISNLGHDDDSDDNDNEDEDDSDGDRQFLLRQSKKILSTVRNV